MRSLKKRMRHAGLDEFEQDIENHLNASQRLSGAKKVNSISELQVAAKKHVQKRNKEKRISIRVFASDLERLKEIAAEEGLPYQTLVTSILHKFSTGRLIVAGRHRSV